MRIGARVWKTGLAVALAITVSMLLGLDRPVFAGIAAIICMQPTVAGSVRKGVERMQATIIGAVFALFSLILMDTFPILQAIDPLMIGATVLVVMAVTLRTGWIDSLVLAAATVVVIMILPEDENMYSYSLSRTIITFVGIIVATGVNAVFITPHYSEPLTRSLSELMRASGEAYRHAIIGFCRGGHDSIDLAHESLAESGEILENVSTTIRWIEEEANLRRKIYRLKEDEVNNLSRIVDTISLMRHSATTIIGIASDVLSRTPRVAGSEANACDVLWNLAQPSLRALDAIETFFDKGEMPSLLAQQCLDMHRDFANQLAEQADDPITLVEASAVAFEISRVTDRLTNTDFRKALARIVIQKLTNG